MKCTFAIRAVSPKGFISPVDMQLGRTIYIVPLIFEIISLAFSEMQDQPSNISNAS